MGIARKNDVQLVHYARFKVNYNDAGIASGVGKQTLPKGSLIIGTDVIIATAFNAATTNVLTIGTTAAGTDIVNAAAVTEGTAAATLNIAPNAATAWAPLAADTQIFATFTQTGTAATAGAAYIIVKYVPDNDQNVGL
jgi:hypothetical protein